MAIFSDNHSTKNNTDNDLYSYGNYIFNGNDSAKYIRDAPAYYSTYFYNAIVTNDAPLEILENAENKFNTFNENYQRYRLSISDSSLQTLLDSSMRINSIQLSALRQYLEITAINEADMLATYMSQGGLVMKAVVAETYDVLANNDNLLLSTIGNDKIALVNILSQIYDNYATWGCINNGNLNEECIDNSWTAEATEKRAKVTELQDEIVTNYRQLITNVINACWNTINILNSLENVE